MRARPAAIVTSLVLALLVNSLVIAGVARLSVRWNAGATQANGSARHPVVVRVSAAATREAAAHADLASAGQAGAARPRVPSGQSSRTKSPPRAAQIPSEVRFYTFSEVDRAAAPESDWNLDVEALDAIGVRRLVFEVLVSDRGDIVECTVLDPVGLDGEVKRDLEQRLSATQLQPALRAGRLVASVRRIELFLVSER